MRIFQTMSIGPLLITGACDPSWGHPRGGSYWPHGFYPWGCCWTSGTSGRDAGASHFAEAEEHEAAADVLEKRYRDA
jgi:hypothetical protein